jgi:LPS-assembly protein
MIRDCNLFLRRCRLLCLCSLLLSCNLLAQGTDDVEGHTESVLKKLVVDPYSFRWLPTSQLTVPQKQQVAPFCHGLYIYPALDAPVDEPEKSSNLAEQPIQISADQIEHQGASGSSMSGSIEIKQGSRRFTADSLTIDNDQRRLGLKDHIMISDPEMVLLAKQAEVDLDSNESELKDAKYLLLESKLRGTAQMLQRDAENKVRIKQGSFSSCEPSDESWVFYADRMELNLDSGFGSASGMHLELGGIPVFYAPYIYFPIDDQRHTGFLMPSIGSSSDAGFELVTPYYINLADNYDMTLTPRLMSERGLLLETEFRYLGERQQGWIDLSWLPGDRGDINPALGLQQYPDRWLVGWHHSHQFGDNWTSQINFNRVSDIDYFRDLDFSGLISGNPNHLDQSIRLGYDSASWSMALQYQDYQTVDQDLISPYGMRPRLSLVGRDLFQQTPFEFDLTTEYTDFYRDNLLLTGTDRVNGKRLVLTPELRYPFEFSWGYIRPAIKYWYRSYDLIDQTAGFDPEPEVAVPVVSLDAGLAFERHLEVKGDDWLQTLEPRIYFLNAEHESQSTLPNFDSELNRFSYAQLFRDNRFSGSDRIGDTQQLSLAISSQLVNASGQRVLDAGLGRIFYFKDREVRLSGLPSNSDMADHSPVAGYLRYWYSNSLNLSVGAAADRRYLTDADMQLQYRKDHRHLMRIGYRFSRSDDLNERIEQPGFSGIWGVDDRWTLVAHWDYDVAQNRTLDALAGLQYDECCWMTSVYARKWIADGNLSSVAVQSKNAVFVQFQLKGFGGIGDKLDQIVRSNMPNFE